MVFDYEYLILDICDENNITDACIKCPYKGESCNNQCMKVIEIYNPLLN